MQSGAACMQSGAACMQSGAAGMGELHFQTA